MTPFQRKLAELLNTRMHKAIQEHDTERNLRLHALACEIEFQIAMDSSYEVGEEFMDAVCMNLKDYI